MRTFLTLFTCLVLTAASAQKENFFRSFITLDSTVIDVENHFIEDKAVKESPVFIRAPFSPIHLTVYGEETRISLPNLHRSWVVGQSIEGWYRDTTRSDFPQFDREKLQYRVVVNGVPQGDWATAGPSIFDRRLAVGDSACIFFRSGNGAAFLNLSVTRRSTADSPPFCIGSYASQDGNASLPNFIQSGIEGYKLRDGDYYTDWPERYGEASDNVPLSAQTKTAYFFRPRLDVSTDSILEYRLVVNGRAPQTWEKSGNIVFVYGLRTGTQYQLEVRYSDKPQYVYKRRFYVAPEWYQTIWFRIVVFSLCTLVILVVILFWRQRRQRRVVAEREGKLRALYAQLNPHFVFNALGSIQGLLNEGEVEKANIFLSDFGKLLRDALDNSDKKYITLQEEVKQLETYVALEQLRRPFQFALYADATLNLSGIEMLPMFFQPIVENAIRHGKRNGLAIDFTLRREGVDMIAIVEDNGVGFDVRGSYPGRGLRLIGERIAVFNRLSKRKKMAQTVNSDAKGTVFCVKFMNWVADD